MRNWLPTIGIELHAQLTASQKLFSPALARTPSAPNKLVAPHDIALPGALPVLNQSCVRKALAASIALRCNISPVSAFDRKHYFYPDLPAGYQITQKYIPLAQNGLVSLSPTDDNVPASSDIRVLEIQLEQDTAKTSDLADVDLNRAGVGLIEIVSAPDISSPIYAAAYVRKVQDLLRHVGASDGNMELGSLRIDANISVKKEGASIPGTRCEIKNLNSIRFMVRALEYEILRHTNLLESGKEVLQESLGFDVPSGKTFALRSKSDSPDYRYMPDPDLPPLFVSKELIAQVQEEIPELPWLARERLCREFDLPQRDAKIIIGLGSDHGQPGAGLSYFTKAVNNRPSPWPKLVSNWMTHELLGQLSKQGTPFAECPLTPSTLSEIIEAVSSKSITSPVAKDIIKLIITQEKNSQDVSKLLIDAKESSGSDDQVHEIATKVIELYPEMADKVRQGQTRVVMRLVGEGMRLSSGRIDGKALKSKLENMLIVKEE